MVQLEGPCEKTNKPNKNEIRLKVKTTEKGRLTHLSNTSTITEWMTESTLPVSTILIVLSAIKAAINTTQKLHLAVIDTTIKMIVLLSPIN